MGKKEVLMKLVKSDDGYTLEGTNLEEAFEQIAEMAITALEDENPSLISEMLYAVLWAAIVDESNFVYEAIFSAKDVITSLREEKKIHESSKENEFNISSLLKQNGITS